MKITTFPPFLLPPNKLFKKNQRLLDRATFDFVFEYLIDQAKFPTHKFECANKIGSTPTPNGVNCNLQFV